MAQVVEHGLGQLPFTEKCVVTGTGHPYIGVDFAKKLCGVSIIRSGESMENALRACCKGIKIGKILVHRCLSRASHTMFINSERFPYIHFIIPCKKKHPMLAR